jgi:predicted nucleic acid-binding protein
VRLLLDTDTCIDVLRGRPQVVAMLSQHLPGDCSISAITEFELYQGAARAPGAQLDSEREKVARLLSRIHVIPFDGECARRAAEINAVLLNAGTPIGILDVLIGATALETGRTLITSNAKDFGRIEGLRFESWR